MPAAAGSLSRRGGAFEFSPSSRRARREASSRQQAGKLDVKQSSPFRSLTRSASLAGSLACMYRWTGSTNAYNAIRATTPRLLVRGAGDGDGDGDVDGDGDAVREARPRPLDLATVREGQVVPPAPTAVAAKQAREGGRAGRAASGGEAEEAEGHWAHGRRHAPSGDWRRLCSLGLFSLRLCSLRWGGNN